MNAGSLRWLAMKLTFVYSWSNSVRHDDDVTIVVAKRVWFTSASVQNAAELRMDSIAVCDTGLKSQE
jgi:hypothetical protein